MDKFSQARLLFPHTNSISYFNSASYGPFCTPVQKAIEANIAVRLAADRDDSHDTFEAAEQLRGDYATLVGADSRQIGLGLNTSFGLNIAAFGLPLEPGDEILVSDIEFPAIVYTWQAAAQTRGLKVRFVASTDRQFDINKFQECITAKTKVLSLSYVQFFNGYKNDLAALSKICKENNIYFVVDGIQGMGVEPVDVTKIGIDIFTSGCQKWLLAPQGCGFFYLSDQIRKRLGIPFMSWLGVDWEMKFGDLFHYDRPYFDSAQKYELGYYAVLNILGMKASANLFLDLGIENIQKHNHVLIDRLADYVKSSGYYTVTSSLEEKHRSAIFTFTCPKFEELHKMILKAGIILVTREGSIRVSVHLFNDESDIDKLIETLEQFQQKQS